MIENLKYSDRLDKVDKYIAKFADSVEFSSVSASRYYKVGGKILRVSDHIGNTSDGLYHIIVKPNGYLIHHPSSGTINIVTYEQVKEFIRVFTLFPIPCGPIFTEVITKEPLVSDDEMIEASKKNEYILGIHKSNFSDGQLNNVETMVEKLIRGKRAKTGQ